MIMDINDFFEVFTGGNSNVSTWTPKAIKEFAEDYHKKKESIAIECLKNIDEPIKYLRSEAEKDGCILNGNAALHIIGQSIFYQELAKNALRKIEN